MTTKCKHRHGDYIKPMAYWLCGQCFKPLSDRPQRYGFVGHVSPSESCGVRQEIVWQAEIKKSSEGTTLSEFLRTMAKRYQRRCRDLPVTDAYEAAIEYLRYIEDEFGDPALCWSHDAAREMADEDMQNWDAGEGAEGNT